MFQLHSYEKFEDGAMWFQSAKLPEETIGYFWDRVEEAKKINTDMRQNLAGNISMSVQLDDSLNKIANEIVPAFYDKNSSKINNLVAEVFNPFYNDEYQVEFEVPKSWLWLNVQKKTEFNPLHKHTGALSFVIWMDIPYDWESEKEVPFVKGSNSEKYVGNFVFYYPTGRGFSDTVIYMNPEINGTMCLFPSWLGHCVYPFYTSDKDRITISGNVVLQKKSAR